MPVDGLKDIVLIIFHWGVVTLGYIAFVYLILLNKWIFSFVFPLINLTSAVLIFNVVQYDITVNTALIESSLNTNLEEINGVISIKLVIYALFVFLLSLFFVYFRIQKIKLQKIQFHLLLILLLASIPYSIDKIRYDTISQRVPFSLYTSIKKHLTNNELLKQTKKEISLGAKSNTDTLTVVLILGEALRADHLSLNNYQRETTPLLKKRDVISFPNIYSEWTYTNKSLPHILTRADSANYQPAYTEQSIISLFKKCNYKTYWIGNQVPGNGYLPFVKNCDTLVLNKPMKTVYNFSKKLDGDLIPIYKELKKEKNPLKFILIHLIGSHWYYPSHYPDSFEKFKPTIKGKTFTQKDKQKIVNAYDNTVLYTDYIVNEVIENLVDENSVLFFLSDHGELLGENNKWFHAQETDFERNPAFVLWFSDKFKEKNKEKINQAFLKKDKKIRTDFLFHSILDISEIESQYIEESLSIFQ